jgi:HK97 family phage major capsid protein
MDQQQTPPEADVPAVEEQAVEAAVPEQTERKITAPLTYRNLAVERSAVDTGTRTVTLAFSSEQPYERSFGIEILDHEASSIDTAFIGSGRAPLLVDHDPTDQVGVVERIDIGADRVARAVVRFGRSDRANEIFNDVADGIRGNVSVGYIIEEMQKTGRDGALDVYRVTKWQPLEISMVSIPADTSVGVGRAAEIQPTEIEVREATMSDNTPTVDLTAVREEAAKSEKARVSEILSIGYRHNVRDDAEKAIKDGLSAAEFRGVLFEKGVNKPIDAPAAEVGLSQKEAKEYSLFRAVNAMANNDWSQAGFEREVSAEIAQRMGKSPRGLFIPADVFKRDLTMGTTTAGGYTVGTQHMGSEFVDALRANMVLPGLGARFMTGLKGKINIPALNAKTTVAFVAENNAPTEGAPTFRQIAMEPRSVSGYVDMSRLLLQNSDPSVEGIIRNDLIRQIAAKIEDVAIEGGGSNEPTGILGTSGIGSVALGTTGDAPTWDSIVKLVAEVEIDDALNGAAAFLTNPKVKSKLARTAKVSSTDSQMLIAPPFNDLYGYNMAVSTLVPSDLTKSTGSALSALIFGVFSELMIGVWSGTDLLVDPYTGSSAGTVRLRIFQEVDVAVRHAESFAAIKDIVTT